MNRYLLYVMTTLGVQSAFGQILPKIQSFEGDATDNWNFTTNPPAFNVSASTPSIWERIDHSGYISGASDGRWFWEARNIDEVTGSAKGYLVFESLDLTTIGDCTLTIDYYASSGLEEIDGLGYEILYDNGSTWEGATSVEFAQDTSAGWVTVVVPIPAAKEYLRLRLWAYTSAGTEYVGFDRIQLIEGGMTQPKLALESPANGAFFENAISNITITGTSTNLAGVIVWSNALNSTQGEVAASCVWCIPSMPLAEGENQISIMATNAAGQQAGGTILLLRGCLLPSDALGRIAFVAFNSVSDSFAFVALEGLPAGAVIRFCDSAWNGLSFGTSEDELLWSNNTATAAGSVVEFYGCDSTKTISNNIGKVVSGKLALTKEGEEIYAYCGTAPRTPVAFLAAISTGHANLNGTGLVYGETAVAIFKTPTSQYYSGVRSLHKKWRSYLVLINSAANWSTTVGTVESWGDAMPFKLVPAATVIMVK